MWYILQKKILGQVRVKIRTLGPKSRFFTSHLVSKDQRTWEAILSYEGRTDYQFYQNDSFGLDKSKSPKFCILPPKVSTVWNSNC